MTVAVRRPGGAGRAGVAAAVSRYDLFLLDEPTNDLDLDGLDAAGARSSPGLRAATVLVSHDREFLARTVTRVVELDLAQQQVNVYGGGYEAYLEEREVARRHAREAYEEYADTKAGAARSGRGRSGPGWRRACATPAARRPTTTRSAATSGSRRREKQAAKARQTERLIERLDVVEEPRKEWELRMEIAAAPARRRGGRRRCAARWCAAATFTLGPVDLQIDWADRVAITGANGSGKSTLLGALLGRVAARPRARRARPRRAWSARSTRPARCSSATSRCSTRSARPCPTWPPADVRTLLAKFGLRAEHVLRPAATLSPGERTRAALALLQARGVNLLVLDEPTNHLDLPAIEQLESALDSYAGTLLLVTHDRRMLDAVHTTRRLHVDGGTVTDG